jgi:hypothetical protein
MLVTRTVRIATPTVRLGRGQLFLDVALFRGRGCAQGRARRGEPFRGKAIDLHEFRRVDIAFAYSMT